MSAFRSSLGSMDSLSGLSELKLEMEEKEGRKVGVWKEYIKADGRKWYYNTETKIQTWKVPDEIKKLDGTSLQHKLPGGLLHALLTRTSTGRANAD